MNAKAANNWFANAIRWIPAWLALTLAMTIAGAVTGAMAFPVGGWVFGYELGIDVMAWNGIKDGAFLTFIWAPGASFVVCLILARINYVKNADYLS